MADVKYSVLEIDGQELDIATERRLDAADVDYDNTVSGLTSTKVKEALDELATGTVATDNFNYWLVNQAVSIPLNQVMNVPFMVLTSSGTLTINGILRFH